MLREAKTQEEGGSKKKVDEGKLDPSLYYSKCLWILSTTREEREEKT